MQAQAYSRLPIIAHFLLPSRWRKERGQVAGQSSSRFRNHGDGFADVVGRRPALGMVLPGEETPAQRLYIVCG